MPSPLDQPQLAALRERVRSLEGRSALNRLTLPFGVPEIDVRGRIQREGEVVHLVAHQLSDLSGDFASVGWRGRVGEGIAGRPNDPNIDAVTVHQVPSPRMPPAKDMADPYGHIDEIRVKTRDFR